MWDMGIADSAMEKLGLLLPVFDLEVTYAKLARYDDCVGIYTMLTRFKAIRLEFEHKVRRLDEAACIRSVVVKKSDTKSASELLAKEKTVHMWLNKTWKPARIDKVAPDIFELLHNVTRFK